MGLLFGVAWIVDCLENHGVSELLAYLSVFLVALVVFGLVDRLEKKWRASHPPRPTEYIEWRDGRDPKITIR